MLGFTVGRSAEAPSRLQRSVVAWSFTRHRYLTGPRACSRAVFWRYVGSRGGHDPHTAPRHARIAWVLRHLTTLPVLLGTVLHTALRQAVIAVVDDKRRPDGHRLLEAARFTLNLVWRNSQPERASRAWDNPAVYPALLEVLYGGTVTRRQVAEVRTALRSRIWHLVSAPLLGDLRAAYRNEVFVGDAYPTSFVQDGPVGPVAVWVSPDAIYGHRTNGSPYSLGRWRRDPAWVVTAVSGSGREDDGRLLAPGLEPTGPADGPVRGREGAEKAANLVGGTLAAPHGTPEPAEYPLERLRLAVTARWLAAREVPRARGGYLGRVVDLADGTERWYQLGDSEMEAAAETVREDVSRLRDLFGADVGGRGADRLRRPGVHERYPGPSDPGTCLSCVFQMLCHPEATEAARLRSPFAAAPTPAPVPLRTP